MQTLSTISYYGMASYRPSKHISGCLTNDGPVLVNCLISMTKPLTEPLEGRKGLRKDSVHDCGEEEVVVAGS